MDKQNLIKILEEIFEDFEIGKLYKFEYKGKNKQGKNKYKIRYTPKNMYNILVDETITER